MVDYYGSLEWLKAPISLGGMARSLFDKLIAVVWKKDKIKTSDTLRLKTAKCDQNISKYDHGTE